MPKVYIVNKSGHDFSSAEKFGDLIFLSEGKINPFSIAKIYRQFVSILRESSEEDYLMVTGLSVMNSVASAIMARKHGRVNWLQYHAERNSYKSRTIMLDELLYKEDDDDR